MSSGFDPERSRISDQRMTEWVNSEVTGELTEVGCYLFEPLHFFIPSLDFNQVPNVGDKTVEAMEREGVHSTWQLFGIFLSLKVCF